MRGFSVMVMLLWKEAVVPWFSTMLHRSCNRNSADWAHWLSLVVVNATRLLPLGFHLTTQNGLESKVQTYLYEY